MQVVLLLLREIGVTSQVFRSRIDGLLAPLGLSYNQFSMLVHLAYQPEPQSISELAASFAIQQPGVSKMVAKFEQSRWVASIEDPNDVRKKLVRITDAGRRTIDEAQVVMGGEVLTWFDGWTTAEQEQLTSLLQRVNASMQS